MTLKRDNKQEIFIYRTSQFERCLDDLRREKGGSAAMAARKVSEFISCLVSGDELARKKFSYTGNGEHRIEHCKKIDLVGGYRLVLIQKDHHFIFLYAGSHDDCFRWIERNKGLSYEVDDSTHASIIAPEAKTGILFPEMCWKKKYLLKDTRKNFWSSSMMIFLKGYLPDGAKTIRAEITSHTIALLEITGGNYGICPKHERS